MRAWLLLSVALGPALVVSWGCEGLQPTLGSGDSASSASPTSTSTTPKTCQGFRDIAGNCLDLSCLDAACDPQAPVPCAPGLRGDGVCFAGQCAYPNLSRGCGGPTDCPCGVCGVDGRCYEDRSGACGACGAGAGQSGRDEAACKNCLSSCQGTGPLCCAGPGCLCEGQCEGFI